MRERYIYYGTDAVRVDENAPNPVFPEIIGPLKPFISMIDGKEVTSRLQYQADLRAHGYVEVGNEVKHLMRPRSMPDPDPIGRKELIAAQIRELGYHGMKKALRRDVEFIRNNSRKD